MPKRFVAVVNHRATKGRYRVLDRKTRNYYAESDEDLNLIVDLADQLNRDYSFTRRQRFIAWLTRRPLPEPTPDPVDDAPAEPEWKRKIREINNLVEQRKREYQIAKGGRLVNYSDPEVQIQRDVPLTSNSSH